jgi:glycerol-3-phosphate acyltransferase PlsY
MTIAAVLIAYLIGSISFAVVVSRALRLPDPRTFGSKNPGATNVLRTGKKVAAALTFLGDFGKGWLVVFLTDTNFATAVPPIYKMSLVAVAVVIGHAYPVFHRFKGGKGASTALGVLLALDWQLAAGTAATWIVIAFFLRISSLAALIAAVFAPGFCFLLYGVHPYTASISVIALLVIWRHKANIGNLLAGSERRIGAKQD